MSDSWVSPCGTIELRQGRWQSVLSDVSACDAVITDPPYSERTHTGFRSGTLALSSIGYDKTDEESCRRDAASLSSRSAGWCVLFCDHISHRWWDAGMLAAGRFVFPPVIVVKDGAPPRLSGDGPASQCEYLCVARPRTKRFLSWGSLPGWYSMQTVRHGHGWCGVSGAKSIDLMRAIVRDYSRPGDLVVDPFAGGATTLLACAIEGRRCIGAECDPETYRKAVKRLSAGWTPVEQRLCVKPKQGVML